VSPTRPLHVCGRLLHRAYVLGTAIVITTIIPGCDSCGTRGQSTSPRVKNARELEVSLMITAPVTGDIVTLIAELSAPVIASECGDQAIVKRVVILRAHDSQSLPIPLPVISFKEIRESLGKELPDLPVERDEAVEKYRALLATRTWPKELSTPWSLAGHDSSSKRISEDPRLNKRTLLIDNQDRGSADPWDNIEVVPHAEALRRLDEAVCNFVKAAMNDGGPSAPLGHLPLVIVLPRPLESLLTPGPSVPTLLTTAPSPRTILTPSTSMTYRKSTRAARTIAIVRRPRVESLLPRGSQKRNRHRRNPRNRAAPRQRLTSPGLASNILVASPQERTENYREARNRSR